MRMSHGKRDGGCSESDISRGDLFDGGADGCIHQPMGINPTQME